MKNVEKTLGIGAVLTVAAIALGAGACNDAKSTPGTTSAGSLAPAADVMVTSASAGPTVGSASVTSGGTTGGM